ncbi:MAG: patatin-like phospholipase family protein [Sphingobacteriales bacterium]|nr:MAG: patatin-like phospholipase family protein [Sphingobacteriales bacterium]
MRNMVKDIYGFLPVQLLLLHFRKYQLLLVFWLIVVLTVTGHFASVFGADTLFLAPEYLGEINFVSMLLLGGATAIFIMAWHITTFIIHSQRVPFMGATRHAFLKYCINNSIIPLAYLIFYSIISFRFQWFNEHASVGRILVLQIGFYLGACVVIAISFLYFFRVDRDLLKVVLSKITNPARIRDIIPYDSLDFDEMDIIRAETYLSGRFKVRKCSELEPYHPRFLHTVLRMHHRNAITATIFALTLLLILGFLMDDPRMRIPAAAGFLMLFSIIMGLVGAMKYFLRSWEMLGWVFIFVLVSWMVSNNLFDVKSIAYGMKYKDELPVYDYNHLKQIFTPERYAQDKLDEEQRLNRWKQKSANDTIKKKPLIVLSISGGGSRASYWTFRSLQYIDSLTQGQLFNNTVLISGASGGMIGAAYWREVHNAARQGKIKNPYDPQYQENVGKDLLNAIIFSFASVDLVSPFNKISIAGYSYTKDRGYAMEQEIIRNTDGFLDKTVNSYRALEDSAAVPAMVINGTITNDGRKLMMAARPVSYLCRSSYSLTDTNFPPIDAVDFNAFFHSQDPQNLQITTALRMNATFPYVLPVVKLPSKPGMNIMDAGLRDNFGIEVVTRYLYVMKDWIEANVSDVIIIEIRDTKEHEVFPPSDMSTLGSVLSDPLFIIQNKWEPFQSYAHGYIKDFMPHYLKSKLHIIPLQYIPQEEDKGAALNFHLTSKEKMDIYYSMNNQMNRRSVDTLLKLMNSK